MVKNLKTKSGFTIIEVVLVLAIAGLIFLMVFLALPALQRSQRDTQRRDDLARFASQISQYESNNRGKVPNPTVTPGIWANSKETSQNTYDESATVNTSGDWTTFLNNYMWASNDTFTDPAGVNYAVQDHGTMADATDSLSIDKMDYLIHVWHGAICDTVEGQVAKSTSGGSRKLAFLYKLEGTGYYCGEV